MPCAGPGAVWGNADKQPFYPPIRFSFCPKSGSVALRKINVFMQTRLYRWTSCPYDQSTLAGLSNDQLLRKRIRNRQAGIVMLALIALVLVMSLALANYLVAVTTWALIPALDDYMKRRKAINAQLTGRGLH